MGTLGRDGRKRQANASRHSARSHAHAGKIGAEVKAEVAELIAKAEAADVADVPDGMSIPDELARREERLGKIAEARAKIEARANERHGREMAEHEAKMAAREAKTAATGKKPGGKPPEPPVEGPGPSDKINLTDGDSRIMPQAGGCFDHTYNDQAPGATGGRSRSCRGMSCARGWPDLVPSWTSGAGRRNTNTNWGRSIARTGALCWRTARRGRRWPSP